MSAPGNKQSWLDSWWPLLVILFGTALISLFDFFKPHY